MGRKAPHYCSCGTRLASDNRTGRCGACRKKDRERFQRPPSVTATFWNHHEIRAALSNQHFGRVLRAYRCHPSHGLRPLTQDVVARWLGVTQSQLSRIENGPPPCDLSRLIAWARTLDIPAHLLWFQLPHTVARRHLPTGRQLPDTVPAHAPLVRLRQHAGTADPEHVRFMRSLRSTDSLIGGAHLYSTVTSYLQHTVAPQLLRGAIAEEEGGVFSAAAGLTEMAGWMAHDAGQDQVADQHFRRALSLARAGHDHQLGAHILASLSHLALHNREPDKAIAFAM